MSQQCVTQTEELTKLLDEKANFDWGDRLRPGPSNPLWSEWLALGRRIREARRELQRCLNEPRSPVVPVPVRLSVEGLQCFEEEDGPGFWPFDTEDDEPYLLVFVLNVPIVTASLRPPVVRIDLPRPRVVKVGPWDDVDDDERTHPAPANALWGADSGLITSPDEALFVAALVENDNSDPEVVRTITEDFMFAELIKHATSAPRPREFALRMVDAMSGSVGKATTMIGSGGVIDPDDRIGPAQELRLLEGDLDAAFCGAARVLSLTFRGDDAVYRVRFRLQRA